MATKSKRLRLSELRALFHLLGECTELGADPIAWRWHLAEQLPALVNCQIGMIHELRMAAPPFSEPFWLVADGIFDHGWPAISDRKPFEVHMSHGRPEEAPHVSRRLIDRRLASFHWHGNFGTLSWREEPFFNEFVKPASLDDGILVTQRTGERTAMWLFVNRAVGDAPFSQRAHRLMRLLNAELSQRLGTTLARLGGPTVTDLPPRQRQVLVRLMQGDSEKQTAQRLSLSPHTVHDYVKLLHTRFGVQSRGELLARCRRFWPVLERLAEGECGSRDGQADSSANS
jgi:DNA-binding CsgD family transcriptional regulator